MEKKVTVIIPAYNEEENIASVIDYSKKCEFVNEIIVVDNLSTDNTANIAREKNAKVISCSTQGKGYAMEEGIKHATNEVIVFLDADVLYDEHVIEALSYPIQNGDADFVKSSFNRTTGGKVTEIAVKPLLNILFPEMYKFSEPISGMIACKKSILEKLEYEKDYGVDIGILLDVISMRYTVVEVNIGGLTNMSHFGKTTTSMSKMSSEIMKAILKRKP